MNISCIELYHLHMPLTFDFVTAKMVLQHRDTLIIKIINEDYVKGFGEVVAFIDPLYTNETLEDALEFLKKIAIPDILQNPLDHPFDIHDRFKNEIQHFPMALAGLENALLDLYTKKKEENIIFSLFNEKINTSVPLGIVFGDLPLHTLCKKIDEQINIHSPNYTNCQRFKIKIKPREACKINEMDSFEKVKILTERFPHLQFLVDANASFSLENAKEIKAYDALNLLCIEEPFAIQRLHDYKKITCNIKTPICFDENIQSLEDVKLAYGLGILQMINLKIGRMGGLYPIKKTIDFCREKDIPFWVGSMVESGISKILHVQLSALKGNCMAGDLSDSKRYFKKDIIKPDIKSINGQIPVPHGKGIGVEVDEEALEEYCFQVWKFYM